jgi:DNA-binding MarR family transcriptional regulator
MSSVEEISSSALHENSDIEDLADIVASMSRFLTRFAGTPPFTEAHLGLAEWLGLMTLKGKPGLSNKQFAKLLGTTVQRAAQISDALKRAELISVDQSVEDARVHSMNVTEAGSQRLSELNGKLTPLVASRLGDKVGALKGTRRNLIRLLRMVAPVKNAQGSKAEGGE